MQLLKSLLSGELRANEDDEHPRRRRPRLVVVPALHHEKRLNIRHRLESYTYPRVSELLVH